MYEFFTFLHIIGFVVWLGFLISVAIILPMFMNQLDTDLGRNTVRKVIRIFSATSYLAAIAVLVSGIFRVVQMNFGDAAKPFWLNYMEMGGGMIVMAGIFFMLVLGRRVTKPLSSRNASMDVSVIKKRLAAYLTAVVVIMLVVLSVIVVVSFKF